MNKQGIILSLQMNSLVKKPRLISQKSYTLINLKNSLSSGIRRFVLLHVKADVYLTCVLSIKKQDTNIGQRLENSNRFKQKMKQVTLHCSMIVLQNQE